MLKKDFEETNYKMSYDEYRACYCPSCDRQDCAHRESYRRFPKIDGGLGMCPNLQYVPIINDIGVLVEHNGKINDYRTKMHAIRELSSQGYDPDELIHNFKNKIYIII